MATATVYRTDVTRDEVIASDVPTEHLVTLSLNALVIPGRSELYGRTHAYYSIAASQIDALEYMNAVRDESERRRIAARALALAGYGLDGIRADVARMTRRRPAVPGSEGLRYRYADDCANCGHPVIGELTGILACGESISWRHRDGFAFGCGGRADRDAAQAIPADEADAVCSVHRKVTRWHACESGGTLVSAVEAARRPVRYAPTGERVSGDYAYPAFLR